MRKLILSSENSIEKFTCKGCVFDVGTKKNPICSDENFSISFEHGFEGGCDNPKGTSGIFLFKEE